MEETKVDLSRLKEKLEMLTGFDLEEAEMEERAAGNIAPDIVFSKRFQARLAAKALGVHPDDMRALKASQYTFATATVSNFLFGDLAEEKGVRQINTEK